MKTVGFSISRKENEFRRALLPKDIKLINHPEMLYFEKGYGDVLGYDDQDYIEAGANICSFEEIITKDIICDPKIGDAKYIDELNNYQTIFGWVHAVQQPQLVKILIERKLSAIAWEDMYECGRHAFWRNNELAGECAIINGFECYAKMPYETKVAIIGRGNTAKGATRILNCLGADCTTYDRRTVGLLKKELPNYDVIVNCVLWDIKNKDKIISKADLKNMKKDSMIIDVSCDHGGAIETCRPTKIQDPTYRVEGVLHYVVDHTPSIFYKTSTVGISKVVSEFLNDLIEERENKVIEDATIIKNGEVINKEILINL